MADSKHDAKNDVKNVVRRARGGVEVQSGVRAGAAKTADKAFNAMDKYIRS